MPDVCLTNADIPQRGRYYHSLRMIVLRNGLDIHEQRSVLWHELVHADRGDECPLTAVQEASVDREAARRAMPWPVLQWAIDTAHSQADLIDRLKVDERLVRLRFQSLHPAERAHVQRRLAHFEETA